MTGVDLEEKARIRAFVRGTAVKAITGSSGNPVPDRNFSLMGWVASAVYEKLDRDFTGVVPPDAAAPGSPIGDVLSGFGGGFARCFPGGSLLLVVRVVPLSYIRSVRMGLISSPDLERCRELARAVRGAGVPCERTAVAYIPFDSNKVSDIKLAPGSDPAARDLVCAAVTQPSERSLQRMPGPSDLADPCDVCLARKIANFLGIDPDPGEGNFSLKAWVGTAVHEKLERDLPKVYDGARLEITVGIAEIPGLGLVSGHVDAYFPEVAALNDYKGLALDTKLPTPDGWTTMGEVSEGDTLLDSQGNPCKVTGKSAVHRRICYRVTFDDGTSVVCDDEHLWPTLSNEGGGKRLAQKVLNTEEIHKTLKRENGQIRHRVINAKPLDLPRVNLPIDPYVLGCWLGDGDMNEARITKPDEEMFKLIEERGFKVGAPQGEVREGRHRARTVHGLRGLLRECALLGDKRIPRQYFRASREQRLDLLRGLMDTDGTWNKTRRKAVFESVDRGLVSGVHELAVSLGQRPVVSEVQRRGFGKMVTAYMLSFTPVGGINPFLSSAKASRVEFHEAVRASRRSIQSVERTVTVPTQCLKVDSPDSTYLCTEAMIPTHNTADLSGAFGITRMRSHGVKTAYLWQTMLYCYGMRRSGLPVEWANLTFIPRDSNRASDVWTATCAYREDVAVFALDRAESLVDVVKSGDRHTLEPDLEAPCFTCVVLPRLLG